MEDPRPAGGDAQEPVLYSAPASLPCQLVRLALVEKGVAHRVRNVNLGALEQCEPWYLKINPKGTVPALVHGGKAVSESEAICRYVDKAFQGASLVPAGSAATVDKFLKLVADVAHEDLVSCAFLKAGHPVAKVLLPQQAEGAASKLKALKASSDSDVVKAAVEVKLAACAEKLAKYAEPAAAYDKAAASFKTLLDALEGALGGAGAAEEGAPPRFACGEAYTLADVAVSCLLARAHWAQEPRDTLLGRPRVAAYFAHCAARPSFDQADVWTALKPMAAVAMAVDAAVDTGRLLASMAAKEWAEKGQPAASTAWHCVRDTAQSAGDAVNTHVLRPVTDSAPYKAASLVVETRVMHPLRDAAHSTGDFLNDKVLTPVKAQSDKAGSFLADAAEATKHAAEQGFEATKKAAEAAAEATKAAAELAKLKAGEGYEATKKAAGEAAQATVHAAERAAEATKHAAEQAKHAAEHAAEQAKHAAEHAAEQAKHAADKLKSGSEPKAGEAPAAA